MNRISQPQLDRLTPQVQPLLGCIARAARADLTAGAAGAAPITLVCGLAEGADRHIARLALDLGFELHAVLPFARERYAADFSRAASCAEFDSLLSAATRVTELPGRPGVRTQAYRRAGHALLDQCDLLLAVWDGGPAHGPGGTAEVIDGACMQRMPVVHISTRPGEPPALLWRRPGRPARGRLACEGVTSRPCGSAQLGVVVSSLMRRA